MAGIPPGKAQEEGLRLLYSEPCRRILTRLGAQPPLPLQALCIAGLARLAFGAANDAVRLAFSDEPDPDDIARLDLFHVAELKRVKGGTSVEIKLFDRQKAMEKLLECAGAAGSAAAASALLQALGGEVKLPDENGELPAGSENGAPPPEDAAVSGDPDF